MKNYFVLSLLLIFAVALVFTGCEPAAEEVEEADEPEEVEAVEEVDEVDEADEDVYPSKPIEFVVPFGAGGGSDRWARAMASPAMDYFDDQPLRVVNRPGGDAAIGTQYMLDQEPDGYTFMISSSTPIMTSMLEDTGFTYEDMICFTTNRNVPTILLADPDGPYTTWEDFIREVEERPGEITLGGTVGLRGNLEHMLYQLGLAEKVNHVPYDSTGEAVTDFLGGHIELAAVTPGTGAPVVEAGNAIAVMYTTDGELLEAVYEGVPNTDDLGLDPFGLLGFLAISADAPEEKIQYLSDAFRELFEDDAFLGLQETTGEALYHLSYPESHEFYVQYAQDLEVLVELLD